MKRIPKQPEIPLLYIGKSSISTRKPFVWIHFDVGFSIARSTMMLALQQRLRWQPSLMFATPTSKVATWCHEPQALQISSARLQLMKHMLQLPVVPRKAAAEVSKIGNL